MVSRSNEAFRQALEKDIRRRLFTDARVMHTGTIGRMVDAEAINKCRLSLYGQQSEKIKKMTHRSGDYDDMEKVRSTYGDYRINPAFFDLEDNLCVLYFNTYGENFYGGEIIDRPEDGYRCLGCGLHMNMSIKLLPDYCPRCKHITPMGRMKKDKVLRRY